MLIQDPIAGELHDVGGAPFGEMERGRVAVREMIVVDVEAAIQAEAAVENERADERAGSIAGRLEQGGERRHARVETEARVVVNAVAVGRHAGEDRRVRGQGQRRRRERVRKANAGGSKTIERRRQAAAVPVSAEAILAKRVDRDQQDVGAAQRSGAPSVGAAGREQAAATSSRNRTSPRGATSYFGATAGAGLANFAASIATFGCTSVSSTTSRPDTQAKDHLNGTLTPATSR